MKWLKRAVVKWVKDDWYNSQPVAQDVAVGARSIDVEGLSFNVMSAQGGREPDKGPDTGI